MTSGCRFAGRLVSPRRGLDSRQSSLGQASYQQFASPCKVGSSYSVCCDADVQPEANFPFPTITLRKIGARPVHCPPSSVPSLHHSPPVGQVKTRASCRLVTVSQPRPCQTVRSACSGRGWRPPDSQRLYPHPHALHLASRADGCRSPKPNTRRSPDEA